MPTSGYRTTVNLPALAANLGRKYSTPFTEWESAIWLVQNYVDIYGDVEPSPFVTEQYGTVLSQEDPRAWLLAEEIAAVESAELPPSHRWRN